MKGEMEATDQKYIRRIWDRIELAIHRSTYIYISTILDLYNPPFLCSDIFAPETAVARSFPRSD